MKQSVFVVEQSASKLTCAGDVSRRSELSRKSGITYFAKCLQTTCNVIYVNNYSLRTSTRDICKFMVFDLRRRPTLGMRMIISNGVSSFNAKFLVNLTHAVLPRHLTGCMIKKFMLDKRFSH